MIECTESYNYSISNITEMINYGTIKYCNDSGIDIIHLLAIIFSSFVVLVMITLLITFILEFKKND